VKKHEHNFVEVTESIRINGAKTANTVTLKAHKHKYSMWPQNTRVDDAYTKD